MMKYALQDPEYLELQKRDQRIMNADWARDDFYKWFTAHTWPVFDKLNKSLNGEIISRRHHEKLWQMVKKSDMQDGKYIDFGQDQEIAEGKKKVMRAIEKVNAALAEKTSSKSRK